MPASPTFPAPDDRRASPAPRVAPGSPVPPAGARDRTAHPAAPVPDTRPSTGRHGERLAREHLERLGLTILAERARTRWGEIDLVAHDDRAIVFCEVKTRVARGGGVPWSSLHERKRRQVRRLAAAWLAENPGRPTGRDVRFDAIGVVLDPDGRLVRLDHVEAAF